MQRVVIIGLFALGLALQGALTLTLRERWRALRWLSVSAAALVGVYILSSAALFVLDRFTVKRALAGAAVFEGVALLARALMARARGRRVFGEIDWDLREDAPLAALLVLALALSAVPFGFFGMGQDQGVYQTEAIDMMNGPWHRVYHYEEYDVADSEADRERQFEANTVWLNGLYAIMQKEHWQYVQALPGVINRVAVPGLEIGDSNYHGVPTFPALMALFGELGGGYGHMMDLQRLLYLLCAALLWYTAGNLGLGRRGRVIATLAFIASPQCLWLVRSALTEMTQALIICLFMYLITEPEYVRRRWWAAMAVTCFACVHVSAYVMYPMFLALFVLLYLVDGDRQYLLGATWASVSYLAGMSFMTMASPYYILFNLSPVAQGPFTYYTAWYAVMGMGLVGLLLPLPLLLARRTPGFKRLSGARWASVALRMATVALLVLGLSALLNDARQMAFEDALKQNGLYVFMWLTGLVSIPAGAVYLLVRGARALKDAGRLAVTVMFLYMVLGMACVMKPQIAYCYYYSRYLGPYVPIAGVMLAVALERVRPRAAWAIAAAGLVAVAPFDRALSSWQDDTYMRFDSLDRVAEVVEGERPAVVFSSNEMDLYRTLCLPLKARGAACFVRLEDVDAQVQALSVRYDEVYYVGDDALPIGAEGGEVLRLWDTSFMDDNYSYRPPLCPLPLNVICNDYQIVLYRCTPRWLFSAAQLYATGTCEDGRLALSGDQVQFGPYLNLEPGQYRLRVQGENLTGARLKVTADSGLRELSMVCVETEDDGITCLFTLEEPTRDVEFVNRACEQETVYIDWISLVRIS